MKVAIIGNPRFARSLVVPARELGLEILRHRDPVRAITTADIVVLATDPAKHPALVAKAARAGKPIYCQAPLGLSLKAAAKALDAMRASNATFAYGAPDSFARHRCAVVDQVAAGKIGKVGFIRIKRSVSSSPHSGGAIASELAHDCDWVDQAFGRAKKVFCQINRQKSIVHVSATLTLKSGAIAQLVVSRSAAEPRCAIEVCGDAGLIQFNSADAPMRFHPRSGSRASNSPVFTDPDTLAFKDFIESIRRGRKNRGDIARAERNVALIEAALHSAKTARAVRL